MTIDAPQNIHIPALRRLWKQAFGDEDAFLDSFFAMGYAPERCRQLTVDGHLAAALYWFDCEWAGGRLAYLYAVATDAAFRGRGLCRALMEDTHRQLKELGYDGAVLVPGSESLFRLYEKMGYRTCSTIREFSCTAAHTPAKLRRISAEAYALLRRQLLPVGSVVQEGKTLAFLQTYAAFYAGENLILAASREDDKLIVSELLGESQSAAGIVSALGCTQGRFRTPGKDKPFSMYHPLSDRPAPSYFGLALD